MVQPRDARQFGESIQGIGQQITKGNFLTKLAWFIEILAALVGIAIGVLIIWEALDKVSLLQTDLGDTFNIKIDKTASLRAKYNAFIFGPLFLLCAVIEICKIPMANAVYKSKTLKWKVIFTIGLFVVMLTTFETVFVGFERVASTRIQSVNEVIIQKQDLVFKINKANEGLRDLEKSEEDIANIDLGIKNLREDKNREIKEIEALILEKTESGEYSNQIKEQKEIIKRSTTNVNQIRKNYETDNEGINNNQTTEIAALDKRLTEKSKLCEKKWVSGSCRNEYKAIEETRKQVLKRYTKRLKDLNEQFNKDKKKYNEDIKESEKIIAQLSATNTENNKAAIKTLNERIKKREEEFQNRVKEIREGQKRKIEEAKTEEVKEKEYYNSIEGYNRALTKLENRHTREVENSQIYRLARMLFTPATIDPETGEKIQANARDVDPKDLNKTILLWFGSLSFIVATMGTFLAFGGLVLDDTRQKEEKKNRKIFINCMKTLYEALLKRLRNPKIVKKVVEKVVEKKVEVPTEVYRDKIVYSEVPKEVVHTDVKYFPIYSDDPELLKHQVVKPKKPEKKPTNKK